MGNTNPLVEAMKDKEFTTIQFIDSAKYLFEYNEITKILKVTVKDTKNHNSLFMTGKNYPRSVNREFGTTYQQYIFFISLKKIEQKIKDYEK